MCVWTGILWEIVFNYQKVFLMNYIRVKNIHKFGHILQGIDYKHKKWEDKAYKWDRK